MANRDLGVAVVNDVVSPAVNGKARVKKPKPVKAATSPKKKKYEATVHFAAIDSSKHDSPPPEFVALIHRLEAKMGMPIWLLIQNGRGQYSEIDSATFKGFQQHKNEIPEGTSVALLIESPGGLPDRAYYIARYFQRRASRFVTIIPQYAKSAATLLALSGNEILMGRDAELGPLDVQVFDAVRERYGSALNTLQSLERIHADAMSCFDTMMQLLLMRTGKRVDLLLPTVLHHSTEFVRPLVEKVDTLDYTEKSRAMKMAEEYAVRLMKHAGYPQGEPEAIARQLVTEYADHGFIIDSDEAKNLCVLPDRRNPVKLRVISGDTGIESIFDELTPFLDSLTVVGRLQEA